MVSKKKVILKIINIVFLFIFFTQCNIPNTNDKIFRYGGGTLPGSIFPQLAKSHTEQQIATQIHSNLTWINPLTDSLEGEIASYWNVNKDSSYYIFYLHDNFYFHPDSCFTENKARSVKSLDIVYSIKTFIWNCKQANQSLGIFADLVGAGDFYDQCSSLDMPQEPIKGLFFADDYSVVFEFYNSTPNLLQELTKIQFAVMPYEALVKYKNENLVGCGPYTVSKENMKKEKWILEKNTLFSYRDSSVNPYFDKIQILFDLTTDKEFQLFSEGQLNIMFNISKEYINRFMAQNATRFQSENPEFIMIQTKSEGMYIVYNSKITNLFFSNSDYLHINLIR